MTSTYATAVSRLSAAQKPGYGAPLYSRWINRPVGRRLAARAYAWGLTPNQVTALSGVSSLVAIILIATIPPTWWLGLAAGGLLMFGYALDSADGQLARLRGGGSRAGEWLDHMVDVAKITALHSVVLVSLYRFWPELHPGFLLVPLGYALASNVFFFGFILIDQLRRASAQPAAPRSGSGYFQSVAALPTDYGILCLIFLSFGVPPVFLVAYTLMFICHSLVLLVAIAKWWRELTREVAPGA
jgi:phosphatidylglycerophosphate synthase